MARECWSCFILFLVIQVVRSEELSTKTCEDLGFTGLALCSDCQVLAEYVKDEELVSDCKKCCVQESEDSISKALKGSVGYIPPEYGLGGRITTKGDVYSYGIVLLEMLTGKMPTHNMFVEGMTLQKWVGSSFPYQVRAVVDRSLLRRISTSTVEDKEFNCLNQLVSVRLLCTKESPEGRSTMMDIVGKLQNFKEILLGVVRNTNFQSDITHLLGCPSTSHNIIGEGQSSSTF